MGLATFLTKFGVEFAKLRLDWNLDRFELKNIGESPVIFYFLPNWVGSLTKVICDKKCYKIYESCCEWIMLIFRREGLSILISKGGAESHTTVWIGFDTT